MKKIRVHLKERSYNILIGRGALARCGAEAVSIGMSGEALVVTNRAVGALCESRLTRSLERAGFSVKTVYVPDSEKAKSIQQAERLMERMGAGRRCKDIFIVALGGGVVGDLAGFVSSIFKRGIPYIQVPTTLLAQVDSAIGGKTAVDLTYAKNMAGAFYQPRMVISDVGLLKSLPDRQIRSGLAEVIKYGVIADGSLFAYIEENLDRILRLEPCALEYAIASCSRIKARIVESDERDTGLRRIVLNYGHTIGHAIESAASYSRLYTHGEAVAIGMVVAADIAREIGMLKPSDAERIESLIARAGLPTSIRSIKSGRILRSHLNDKKFTLGVNRFVLPRSIGSAAVVRNVPYKVVGDAIRARAHPAA